MGTNISFKMDVTWSCHNRTGHCEVSKYILRTCMSGCCALNEKIELVRLSRLEDQDVYGMIVNHHADGRTKATKDSKR